MRLSFLDFLKLHKIPFLHHIDHDLSTHQLFLLQKRKGYYYSPAEKVLFLSEIVLLDKKSHLLYLLACLDVRGGNDLG